MPRASKPKPRGRPSPYRPHPWHGLDVGPEPPEILNAFSEITPFDLMKYEVDKVSGYLHVDRPQRTSSQPLALYGFVPPARPRRQWRDRASVAQIRHAHAVPLEVDVVADAPGGEVQRRQGR